MSVWQSVVLGQRYSDGDDVSVCVCVYGLKVCQCHFGQAYYIYTFVLSFVGASFFCAAFLNGLRSESRDVAVSQLLHYLPLLRPANAEGVRGYVHLLPRY